MASSDYMTGRRRYTRPQAALWSNNPGTLSDGLYVPTGYEYGASLPNDVDSSLVDQFLILSDHNRSEIKFNPKRIEQRQRTINGRMRSYHIADKLEISMSWDNLPSRSFNASPEFDADTGLSELTKTTGEYTVDGGAGGVDLLDWYETHKGPFWMFLSYDKHSNFKSNPTTQYAHLAEYNQVMQVYISDFSYSVVKRGGSNFDFWNVSVTLEEA